VDRGLLKSGTLPFDLAAVGFHFENVVKNLGRNKLVSVRALRAVFRSDHSAYRSKCAFDRFADLPYYFARPPLDTSTAKVVCESLTWGVLVSNFPFRAQFHPVDELLWEGSAVSILQWVSTWVSANDPHLRRHTHTKASHSPDAGPRNCADTDRRQG
jgi:hypothetical protein